MSDIKVFDDCYHHVVHKSKMMLMRTVTIMLDLDH